MQGNALIPLMGEPMNLGRNVLSGAVAGNQLMNLIEDRKMAPMRQQAAQMEVEAGKITLSKEKAIEQLRNAAIDGSYIRRDLASGDLNTAISRMEQRNRRIMESGGDNQHTQQWLSALSSRDPAQIEAVAAEMEEIERAYQTYGGGTAVTDPRTNKMKELEAAGIKPGTPEYQQAVLGQTPTNKQRELAAAGITPGTPEYRQAVLGSSGGEGATVKPTSNEQDWNTYTTLKQTDPVAAESFGRAAGFVSGEGSELSVHLQKRLSLATDAAQEARTNSAQFSVLAGEIEKADMGGGVFASTWPEKLKEITGTQDAESLLRKRYLGVRSSQVVKNLPPGAASDADIAMALEGFPPGNANKTIISQFLRGMAKLEDLQDQFETYKADYISEKGTERGLLESWRESSAPKDGGQVVDWSSL